MLNIRVCGELEQFAHMRNMCIRLDHLTPVALVKSSSEFNFGSITSSIDVGHSDLLTYMSFSIKLYRLF